MSFFTQLQDRTGADETDSGDNSLNHTRQPIETHLAPGTREHNDRRAESNENVGAKTRGLARSFALESDDRTKQRRYYDAQ